MHVGLGGRDARGRLEDQGWGMAWAAAGTLAVLEMRSKKDAARVGLALVMPNISVDVVVKSWPLGLLAGWWLAGHCVAGVLDFVEYGLVCGEGTMHLV